MQHDSLWHFYFIESNDGRTGKKREEGWYLTRRQVRKARGEERYCIPHISNHPVSHSKAPSYKSPPKEVPLHIHPFHVSADTLGMPPNIGRVGMAYFGVVMGLGGTISGRIPVLGEGGLAMRLVFDYFSHYRMRFIAVKKLRQEKWSMASGGWGQTSSSEEYR